MKRLLLFQALFLSLTPHLAKPHRVLSAAI